MSVQVRQNVRIGGYLLKQKLLKRKYFPLLVELEPLFQCNLACSFCGKIQYPEHILKKRLPVAAGARRDRGVRRADGLDRGRRAARAPRGARHGRRARRSGRSSSSSARTPSCWRRRWTTSSRRRTSRGSSTSTACASGTTRSSSARAHSTRRSPRSRRRSARGFRVNTNTTFLTTDTPKTVREVLDFLNDELEVDSMLISPAYAYEKAPDQEHFPGVRQTRELFSEAFRGRQAEALAAQPHAALPRLPRGQGRLRVHAVGHPELLDLRLAAALLPHGRRLHRDLPRADRDDRLVAVRPGQRRPLRQLHGPLRLRADSRPPLAQLGARGVSVARRALIGFRTAAPRSGFVDSARFPHDSPLRPAPCRA